MTEHKIDLSTLRVVLTHSGFVALECDALESEEQVSLFGDQGALPPQKISALVAETLELIRLTPDDDDVSGLKEMAADLHASAKLVDTAIMELGGE